MASPAGSVTTSRRPAGVRSLSHISRMASGRDIHATKEPGVKGVIIMHRLWSIKGLAHPSMVTLKAHRGVGAACNQLEPRKPMGQPPAALPAAMHSSMSAGAGALQSIRPSAARVQNLVMQPSVVVNFQLL